MASHTLKIATFNINGVRARIDSLIAWLEREQPDIVCLQELKALDIAFPKSAIKQAGYGAIWSGQASWNGVAILAKAAQPQETRRGLPGDPRDTHSRYLEADIAGICVGCLYLPNGNPQPGPKFDYKLAWFERLIKYAAPLMRSDQPVVLAGDYNVVPTDFDIYDPKSWRKDALLQPETRECYARLLKQGWVDALRATHPDEQIFTFWDYFRQHWQRNAGLRIDHLLLNKPLAPLLVDAGVDRWVRDRERASDHAPTWITLGVGDTSAAKRSRARARVSSDSKAKSGHAKTPTTRSPAKKKSSTAKPAPPARTSVKAPVAKQAGARKTPARKTTVKRAGATKPAPRKR